MPVTDPLSTLAAFVRVETGVLLTAFAIVVAYQILTGRISTKGMFTEKKAGGGYSPVRLQLLVLSLAGLVVYLAEVIGSTDTSKMPEVPVALVAVLGGSNLVYLLGKSYSLLLRR